MSLSPNMERLDRYGMGLAPLPEATKPSATPTALKRTTSRDAIQNGFRTAKVFWEFVRAQPLGSYL